MVTQASAVVAPVMVEARPALQAPLATEVACCKSILAWTPSSKDYMPAVVVLRVLTPCETTTTIREEFSNPRFYALPTPTLNTHEARFGKLRCEVRRLMSLNVHGGLNEHLKNIVDMFIRRSTYYDAYEFPLSFPCHGFITSYIQRGNFVLFGFILFHILFE